ncbi:hypothetical protein [[Phormidium] sp. LEGE 05292]|uniref:hypothetical protein n=1 Tax=[Phormidium] sp. LEGE 05292 TaxID=767427 RepID=UPI001D142759|nr:hypothetical protein [Phormidium sp. LEGE 05292]
MQNNCSENDILFWLKNQIIYMAKLPAETLSAIFSLQQQFLEQIDEARAVEFVLLEQFGETEETIPELDELSSIRERADSYYSRFYVILRRIYDAQPVAPRDILELLSRYISEADGTIEAIQASIQDIKRNWNLL